MQRAMERTVTMKLVYKLKESTRIKQLLFYLVVIFTGFYIFCVPSFGSNSSSSFRYLVYLSMIMLGGLSICYCFLYLDFRLHRACILIPIFVVYALLGTVIYSKAYREWFSLVLLAGSFFIFIYAFKIIKSKQLIVSIISISFFLFSLYFIFHFRKDILSLNFLKNGTVRLGHPFDNPNGVAAFAIIGVSAPLYLLLFTKKITRFLFLIPFSSCLIVGLSTGSRTFLLVLFVFILVFLFFKFKKHKLIYLVTIAVTIGVFAVVINLPFMGFIKERFVRAFGTIFGTGTKVDTATLERVIWTDYGFYLGFKRLIFGYGVSGFEIASGVGTYSHSNFAETLCDFGLIGFIMFYVPLVLLIIEAIFSKKIDKVFVVSFVIYYFVASFSNVIYYKKIYYLILAFMYYLVFFDNVQKSFVPCVGELKKIVFTCDSMGAGGAEKVIATLSNEMNKHGIQVTIIGVGDLNQPHSFYKLDSSVKYLTLADGSGKRINSFKRIFLLKKEIVSIQPDIVVSFLPNANVYTHFSLIGTSIPYINSERNNPWVNPSNKIERLLKKISFRKADGSVFQTYDALNFYPEVVRRKATVIKNPILLGNKSEKSVINRNKIILAVGRLTKQKNYINLLNAFKIFNEKMGNKYKLKIYGDGPLKDELLNYCKTINIQNNVIFMGNDNNWHENEINDAMYILSSDYEGLPNSLAEAMALGIPCISTDCPCGGSRELIKDGQNGFLVPVNDPLSLAEKMIQLANQSPNAIGIANKNMADEYSPTNVTKLWIEYIKGLTKEVYE